MDGLLTVSFPVHQTVNIGNSYYIPTGLGVRHCAIMTSSLTQENIAWPYNICKAEIYLETKKINHAYTMDGYFIYHIIYSHIKLSLHLINKNA